MTNEYKKKLLKSISLNLILAIITTLIITIFSPVSAQENIKNIKSNSSQTSLIAQNKTNNPQRQFDLGKILFEKADFKQAAATWQDAAAGFERQGDKINQAWSLNFVSLALQNLGELQQAQTAIDKSLKLLQNQQFNTEVLAVALNTEGSLKIKMGQANAALEAW